jgi:hypothetical protein
VRFYLIQGVDPAPWIGAISWRSALPQALKTNLGARQAIHGETQGAAQPIPLAPRAASGGTDSASPAYKLGTPLIIGILL